MPEVPVDDPLRAVLAAGPVRLEPFGAAHIEPLRAACAQDPAIWDIYPYSMLGEHFDRAIAVRAATPGVTFAVHNAGEFAGTTMYLRPDPVNGTVEIGGTYLAPRVRGNGCNAAMKRLLIDHAFANGYRRIEFRVDARNARSRAAVLKLGAVHEGTLRADRVTWTGHCRDTCVYGLLREDWKS